MGSDAEEFYDHQRSIGVAWGVVLPSWTDLSWDERIDWENRYAEQATKEAQITDGNL